MPHSRSRPRRRPAGLPVILTLLLALAAPASAETLRLTYHVQAAGMIVAEMEARFDLSHPDAYQVEMKLRTRGVAGFFISGEQVTQVSGAWSADAAQPRRYAANGLWRGVPRHILLEYEAGEPRIRRLEPPNDEEREAVPPHLARGTMDGLSALAQLARRVGNTGRCEAEAAVYDGRRRTDFTARSQGWERLPPRSDGWHGDALRCDFEGRMMAGFRLGEDRARAARPQPGRAWIARLTPGSMPVPVRVEMQSGWFGTVTAWLVGSERLPG